MATAPKTAPTLKVQVVRAFYYQGKPIAVGETPTLPAVFAREMIAAHKAESFEEAAPISAAAELNLDPDKNSEPDKTNPGKRGSK